MAFEFTALKHKLASAVIALGATTLLAGIALPALAQQKIKLGTPARITYSYAPFLMAIEMGYMKDEGIELEIVEFLGTSLLVPQVANKSVDIGFPSADIVIINRQPGKDYMPVRFFYNSARSNIWEFAVLEDSPIKSIADLKGKKIGIGALANGNVPITRGMYKEMGMTAGKDYDFVPTGVGAPAIRALTNKDVDAFNGFDAIIAQFETAGLKIRRLDQPTKYSGLLSNGFMVHEDTLKSNPKLLAGFGRAISKGVVACEANMDFCVRNTWKYYPSTRGDKGTEAEQLTSGRHILESRMKRNLDFRDIGGARRFGEYAPQVWKDYIDVLFDGGELTSKQVDINSLYTNEFVPEFNKFDPAQVQAQAKARQ